MSDYKYFDLIKAGNLFESSGEYVDLDATRRLRDRVLIDRVRMYSEILRSGMMDHRRVADDLLALAKEADQIEEDCGGF